MKSLSILVFIIVIFSSLGCYNTDKLLFKINDKFGVYQSPSCDCNAICLTTMKGSQVFLKNVKKIKGNKETFLVQTGPKDSNFEMWVMFNSDDVEHREDYFGIEGEKLQTVLDTLEIEFEKLFEQEL